MSSSEPHRPELHHLDSGDTTSSDDYDVDHRDFASPLTYTQGVPPGLAPSAIHPDTSYPWDPTSSLARSHDGPASLDPVAPSPVNSASNTGAQRPQRPPVNPRQSSNVYAPARRPHQYSLNTTTLPTRQRAGSTGRSNRKTANQEYRAQERAYVQRIRQDAEDL